MTCSLRPAFAKHYLLTALLFLLAACGTEDNEPVVIYITATPLVQSQTESTALPIPIPATQAPVSQIALSPVPANLPQPTADPARFVADGNVVPQEHIVQPGDTLYGISLIYGTSLNSILAVNTLEDPNALEVGQVILLPAAPSQFTPSMKIVPDSKLVRGPGSTQFDVAAFVAQQPGYIRTAFDEVTTGQADGSSREDRLNAAQIIERVALEFSVDPRLLLALLEYRAGWLSIRDLPDDRLTHPLISSSDSAGIDRSGLYRQLAWTANMLNMGYYGWKFRGWTIIEFDGGTRTLIDPGLNGGTVGVMYLLSRFNTYETWLREVDSSGFFQTYYRYFGDPFLGSVEPIVPPAIGQPSFTLPFAEGETWFYTGGWHGGWGAGSAWAAVDFAPPDDPQGLFCYTSQYAVRAVAPGLIVRSHDGSVILDLDGDGDEATGWTVLYLHVATQGRIAAGQVVNIGDVIGYAACEGGFSTATHLHIARRYNGEWIPADCSTCTGQDTRPSFVMGGWQVIGLQNQEYQGFLERGVDRLQAEQGRLYPNNRVSW